MLSFSLLYFWAQTSLINRLYIQILFRSHSSVLEYYLRLLQLSILHFWFLSMAWHISLLVIIALSPHLVLICLIFGLITGHETCKASYICFLKWTMKNHVIWMLLINHYYYYYYYYCYYCYYYYCCYYLQPINFFWRL